MLFMFRKYRKYGIRLAVALFVYSFFHVNSSTDYTTIFRFGTLDKVFIIYTTIVVLLIWEILDFAIQKVKAINYDLGQYKNIFKLFAVLTLVSFPFVVGSTWVSEYIIKAKIDCCYYPGNGLESFVKMTFQGQLLAWLIIGERILQLYHDQNRRIERDKALMQKELLQSQYVNLKNQVRPHFLFNSFSVLQSLIDTRPEEASKFLSRLSKMYRYILDSREESMSSVEKELDVLDLYLYLLKIRHEESFEVN